VSTNRVFRPGFLLTVGIASGASLNSPIASNSTDSHTHLISKGVKFLTISPPTSPASVSRRPSQSRTKHHRPLSRNTSSPSMGSVIDPRNTVATSLSPQARRQLIRSTRKLSKILGETPVLPPSFNNSVTPVNEDVKENMAEFGFASFSSSPSKSIHQSMGSKPISPITAAQAGFSLGTRASRYHTIGTSPHPEAGAHNRTLSSYSDIGMYDGIAHCLSVPPPSVGPHSLNNKQPPVLNVDCSLSQGDTYGSKRSRTTLSPKVKDDDGLSIISNSTVTSGFTDLFSLTSSKRRSTIVSPVSPLSPSEGPTPTQSLALSQREKEKIREARRSKVAKLSRYYGEHVPAELVFRKPTPSVRVTDPHGPSNEPSLPVSSLMKRRNEYFSRARSPRSPLSHHSSFNDLHRASGTNSKPARPLSRSSSVRIPPGSGGAVLVRRGTKRKAVPQLSVAEALSMSTGENLGSMDSTTAAVSTPTCTSLSPLRTEEENKKFLTPTTLTPQDAARHSKKIENMFGEAPPSSTFLGNNVQRSLRSLYVCFLLERHHTL
jgi:hypothetical protein